MRQATCRSDNVTEKTKVCREGKGKSTCKRPGVWPVACGERVREIGPEILTSPQNPNCGKHQASRMKPASEDVTDARKSERP